MTTLIETIRNKHVCLIGTVPPKDIDLSKYELVARCNEHWALDEGRCDIWIYCGGENKIKMSWFMGQDKFREQLKFVASSKNGAATPKLEQICNYINIPFLSYSKEIPCLEYLYYWFEIRGVVPSTGLIATVLLLHCQPERLLVTGMNLHAGEVLRPEWASHSPVGHAEYLWKISQLSDKIRLGSDLLTGIAWWLNQETKKRQEYEDFYFK